MRQYLADQKQAHVELSEVHCGDGYRLTQEIDDRVAAYTDKIKTPDQVAG